MRINAIGIITLLMCSSLVFACDQDEYFVWVITGTADFAYWAWHRYGCRRLARFGCGFLAAAYQDKKSGSINLLNAQVANVPTVKLNNGLEMPQFGLGTYQLVNNLALWRSKMAIATSIAPTLAAIDKMLERLQMDYVDLLYVHQPIGDWDTEIKTCCNMPEWAQIMGNASPLKYFIQTLRMVYLKGATFAEMQHLFYPLCGLAVFFNGWAVLSYRKKS